MAATDKVSVIRNLCVGHFKHLGGETWHQEASLLCFQSPHLHSLVPKPWRIHASAKSAV